MTPEEGLEITARGMTIYIYEKFVDMPGSESDAEKVPLQVRLQYGTNSPDATLDAAALIRTRKYISPMRYLATHH